MARRVFGPVRGAGVQITELEGEKPIEPGLLGFAGYAGLLEKGPVGELISVTSKNALLREVGSFIPESLLPDATQDYFSTSVGAGGLLLVRITDGNELAADGYLVFDRSTPTSVENLYVRRDQRTPLGKIKAKNGGRWGGKRDRYTKTFALAGDLTEISLTTGIADFARDQWKGGFIELHAVPNKRYPIIGNTAAGVINVELDQTMATDLANSGDPTNFRYYLALDNDAKALSYEIRDGEELPDSEFGLFVYVDGVLTLEYPDLSIDPTNKRYWESRINNDGNNREIEVEDTFVGLRTADVRPANYWGTIGAVSATTLTRVLHEFLVTLSPGGADPTFALGTTTDDHLEQKLTVTMDTLTDFSVVSDRFGPVGSGTLGALFTAEAKWVPPFTITNGGTALAIGDQMVIRYKPFEPNALAGGFLFPDKPNAKRSRFRIVGNTHDVITVADGSDLTAVGAIGDEFLVQAPRELEAGRDGHADVTDTDFIQKAWDVDTSPFNRVVGKNLGLIKFGTPGNTSVAVQKAGAAYALGKNHQYRYEVPDNIVTEDAADAFLNETLGRTEYAVVSFPSFVDVLDPEGGGEGRLKRVSATGMIHGKEARIANDNLGYHKAEAGIDAILPAVLDIPTKDKVLNEEILNAKGINVIKKVKGNFILWGDRTLWLDPTWKFKHQREQMSFYEHVLQESFDFIIFGLNNQESRTTVRTSLISFFQPEFVKGALDTDLPFEEAASIKIDTENNTPATKAAGDMFVEILLALVGVVERLRILIGKRGIFEAAA